MQNTKYTREESNKYAQSVKRFLSTVFFLRNETHEKLQTIDGSFLAVRQREEREPFYACGIAFHLIDKMYLDREISGELFCIQRRDGAKLREFGAMSEGSRHEN